MSAAAAAFGTFREMPADDFDRCLAVSFGGAVDTIRAVLPHLERSGGRLGGGQKGRPSVYAALRLVRGRPR